MAEQSISPQVSSAAGYTRPRFFKSKQFQDNFVVTLATISALLGLVIVLLPLAWMISTSLKGQIEALKMPPTFIPVEAQWQNYPEALVFGRDERAFAQGSVPIKLFGGRVTVQGPPVLAEMLGQIKATFITYFYNTAFRFAIPVMIGEVLSASFIAFGFARLRAPGRNLLFLLVLATLMIPAEVTLIPQYVLFSYFNKWNFLWGPWLDSYRPLVLPAWFGSAYLIFLMRQFFMGLPREYDEAAIIEGANPLGIWWRIILPLSKPALGAVAIMSFIFQWNTFQGPLIYLNANENYPVSLGLAMFRAPFGGTPWHWYMAASLTVILPCIIVFYVAQRYFIQGIVVSGVKG